MTPVRPLKATELPMAPVPPLVAIRDLTVELGGFQVLSGVTADIARGQITALIGLNGSGKTTLLRAVVGEYPYRGQIKYFCGHDHSSPTPEYVGYVPQRLIMDARMPLTVVDLFALALSRRPLLLGISRHVSKRAAQLLERVGLPDVLNRPVESLSGGQLQRVLLALALEPSPELLLLDEPAAGIDFKDLTKFYDLISQINRETGITILLVSHDLNMVNDYSHHILCLSNGTIACQGAPEEILAPANLSRIFGAEFRLNAKRSS